MIRFECDYAEGAHERVMQRLMETNMEQTSGYGMDCYCDKARDTIKKLCKDESLFVHFLVGGTQTNKTVIDAVLRPHQGVLCADSGHINVHESGAIESCGHKVMALLGTDGKITAQQILTAYHSHYKDSNAEHTVQPGMVYISSPTEYGTLYSLAELEAISSVCKETGLYLFLDGARLGYGLMAEGNDVTLEDLARLTDVFYIGGTKVGALFGEAVVIKNPILNNDFRYIIKQNGGMLAKGRLLGLQFETLLQDGLYFTIAKKAVDQAMQIKKALADQGIQFLFESSTNQQFPILTKLQQKQLNEKFAVSYWEAIDEEKDVIRICTSWATKQEDVDALISCIREF